MLINREQLCELIPHSGTMCLLESVQSWDKTSIVCTTESHLRKDNPLLRNGRLSAIHAVEYGAQAMAVHGGLLAREHGKRIKQGYLAALRDVKLYVSRLDDLASPLQVQADQLIAGEQNLMYTVQVQSGSQIVAEARATVVNT